MLLIGGVGCCGAYKDKKTLLIIYAIINMGVAAMVFVTVGVEVNFEYEDQLYNVTLCYKKSRGLFEH